MCVTTHVGSRCLEKGHQHRARPDRRETGQFVELSSTSGRPGITQDVIVVQDERKTSR